MADVFLPVGGADHSVIALIDNDNNSIFMKFIVEHDGGGAGKGLLQVWESGRVIVEGPVQRAGTIQIRNNTALSDPCIFYASSPPTTTTQVVKVWGDGNVYFDVGGVRLPVRTSTPNGVVSGEDGDVLIYNNSGKYEVWICNGAGTTWTKG